ncbi:MAG TPA: metallophosphoesterase [Thermoplasmata archaeon]|nr:metallophosphoesterase [Thermoplasmata archaeon]
MRLCAVGDIHGREFFGPFSDAISTVEDPDLFLLAGDTTDHNRIEEFGEVVAAVKTHTTAPIVCVFGNNEWTDDHGKYRQKFDLEFLDDEAKTFTAGGESVRIIGSTGALDEPTWWQRNNLPGIEREYEMRVRTLDQLLAGEDFRILLTHYPPTHATMGGEKESWRAQLGSKRLEAVVLRRRPDLVIHGHVHKGIPFAEIRTGQSTIESFGDTRTSIPVYNVAFPVTKKVTTIDI